MSPSRGRLVAPVVLLTALALLSALALGGCGNDGDDSAGSTPANPHSAGSAAAARVASPCDTLPAAEAGRILGARVTAVPDERDSQVLRACSYAAIDKADGVSLDVTSLYFDGDFEDAWATMADSVQGKVTRIDVPGADAARLVVQPQREALLVTGFVKHGTQVDTANLVDLSPPGRAAVRATMAEVLARLVSAAD